jgi:hypothetical protein
VVAVKNMTSENLGINLGGRVKIGGIFGGRKFERWKFEKTLKKTNPSQSYYSL